MIRKTFIISRTDAIGDVVLTLPVAGVLRSLYPEARIIFLGRSYTEEVIKACEHVDEFLDWDQLRQLPEEEAALLLARTKADTIIHVFPHPVIAKMARRAGIKTRIGTTNRLYHWFTCNRLVRLSRKNSPYHEAQLNLLLLSPLGAKELYTLKEIAGLYGLTRLSPLPAPVASLLDPGKFNLILHPKSRGHGREWGLDNFMGLAELLPRDRFALFVSGGTEEGQAAKASAGQIPFPDRPDRHAYPSPIHDVYLHGGWTAGIRYGTPPPGGSSWDQRPRYFPSHTAHPSGTLGAHRTPGQSIRQ